MLSTQRVITQLLHAVGGFRPHAMQVNATVTEHGFTMLFDLYAITLHYLAYDMGQAVKLRGNRGRLIGGHLDNGTQFFVV